MNIGIRNGKVWCKFTKWKNRRLKDDGVPIDESEVIYISYDGNVCTGDTWDFENNCSLMDSPKRTPVVVKNPRDNKIKELEDRIKELEDKLK